MVCPIVCTGATAEEATGAAQRATRAAQKASLTAPLANLAAPLATPTAHFQCVGPAEQHSKPCCCAAVVKDAICAAKWTTKAAEHGRTASPAGTCSVNTAVRYSVYLALPVARLVAEEVETVSICVHILYCLCVLLYVYIHTQAGTHIHTYTYKRNHIDRYVDTDTTETHTCMHTHACSMYIYICMYVTHMYICLFIYFTYIVLMFRTPPCVANSCCCDCFSAILNFRCTLHTTPEK